MIDMLSMPKLIPKNRWSRKDEISANENAISLRVVDEDNGLLLHGWGQTLVKVVQMNVLSNLLAPHVAIVGVPGLDRLICEKTHQKPQRSRFVHEDCGNKIISNNPRQSFISSKLRQHTWNKLGAVVAKRDIEVCAHKSDARDDAVLLCVRESSNGHNCVLFHQRHNFPTCSWA